MKDYEFRVTLNDLKEIGKDFDVKLEKHKDDIFVARCNNEINLKKYKKEVFKFIISSSDINKDSSGKYYFMFY